MSERQPDPRVPKDLNHIFEWMHRMTTASPGEKAVFAIEPALFASPEDRAKLVAQVTKLAQMLKLEVRIATSEGDPDFGYIKIVRPK